LHKCDLKQPRSGRARHAGPAVAFSLDGSGQYWHLATELMRGEEASRMYAWLEAVDERRPQVFHDRRKWVKPHARYTTHGIYTRAVTLG
jgi:hypothetical protein